MTKNQKRHHRQGPRSEKKHATERSVAPRTSRIKEYSKELSKKLLHDYILPMTRTIEHSLQRLERAL